MSYDLSPWLDDDDDKDNSKKSGPSRPELELLEKHRTLFISEGISPKVTKRLLPQMLWLDSISDEPIRLFINTPGGSADDGFAIHDTIRFLRSPVQCVSIGLNASAGTIILLASPKEMRYALPNTRIMIHQPAGGAQGKASDIEITAEQIIELRRRANELIAEECGQPFEKVEKDTNNDRWFSPDQALEYGLIGKVVQSTKDL